MENKSVLVSAFFPLLRLSICLLRKFFFYGSILHFSLFQVPGTPHSGCPTDSCATSPEMMRVLVAFPISLDLTTADDCRPIILHSSRASRLLRLRVTAVWPVFLSSPSPRSTSSLTECSSYSFLFRTYGLWKLFFKKTYSLLYFFSRWDNTHFLHL